MGELADVVFGKYEDKSVKGILQFMLVPFSATKQVVEGKAAGQINRDSGYFGPFVLDFIAKPGVYYTVGGLTIAVIAELSQYL